MSTIQEAAAIMNAHADLATEEDARAFDDALISCGGTIAAASVEDVKALLRTFRDDVAHVEVQESLRGLLGRAPKNVYIEALLGSLADMHKLAPTWAAELMGFASSNAEYADSLIAAAKTYPSENRDVLVQVLQEAALLGFAQATDVMRRLAIA